jgi:hypothetical protein
MRYLQYLEINYIYIYWDSYHRIMRYLQYLEITYIYIFGILTMEPMWVLIHPQGYDRIHAKNKSSQK